MIDPALLLLLRMRLAAGGRRFRRGLRTPKGLLLGLIGLAVFLPALVPVFVVPRADAFRLELARRLGVPLLLLYLLMTLVTTGTAERAIVFSPAEVSFLFPGPFRQRQLLAYKIAIVGFSSLCMSLFLGSILGMHAASLLASYIATALGLFFVQLFAIATGLAANTIGVMAHNRRRKLALVAAGVMVLAVVLQMREELLRIPLLALPGRIEASTAYHIASLPVRPFVEAFTAERVWPDLVGWAVAGLAIDAALLAAIFALDAQYLEASAAVSAKIYEKVEQVRRSGGATALMRSSGRVRSVVPMFPYLGGAGPIAWRQLTTATRPAWRLVFGALLIAPALIPVLFNPDGADAGRVVLAMLGTSIGMGVVFTAMFPFDFRSDLDRMPELKALPIRPTALAAGQVVAPVVMLTIVELSLVAIVLARVPAAVAGSLVILGFIVPYNLMLVAIDNILFLWFPIRTAGGTGFDFQLMGRAMLLMGLKFAAVGGVSGLTALAGLAAYYLADDSLTAAFATAWAVLALCSAALVPLAGHAFARFDVAADTPA